MKDLTKAPKSFTFKLVNKSAKEKAEAVRAEAICNTFFGRTSPEFSEDDCVGKAATRISGAVSKID